MLQNQSGLVFGIYQLLKPVGWGGMSVVYQGLKAAPETGILAPGNVTEVAVKVMTTNKEDSLSFYRRFQREVRVSSALAHPHILPVSDYGIANDQLYLVMPYMRCGTLEHRIREQKSLTLTETLTIASQIGSALDHAHSKNIVHRDVKPNNIMIGGEHQYYLADFGLVKILDGTTRLTMTGRIIGTPAYMSPEQANGAELDHRTDIYSFGIVLYECLLGRLPYPFETQAQAIGQHLSADAIRPRSINPLFPQNVEKVLMRALHKDPAKRYQSATELISALEKAVQKCPPELRESPLVTPEQIQRSRSEELSQARLSAKNPKSYAALCGVVVGILLTVMSFAALWQMRVIKPEVVLALIIQNVEAVQTQFKQDLLFPTERVLIDEPIQEAEEAAIPQRPVLIRLDEDNSESPSDESKQPEEADDTVLTAEEPSSEVLEDVGPIEADEPTTPSKNGDGQPATPGNGSSSANSGNGNGTASQGNGNGSGTTDQGNANGNGNGAANGNGNSGGSGDTDGGNGNPGQGNGNSNGTASPTTSENGSASDSASTNASAGNGNGSSNGNENANGNGNSNK